MKVVVFGGSGFVGSHVADALSEAGYRVLVFDRVASPYLRNDQEMMVGDILEAEAVRRAVTWAEVVYHFAGIADLDDASTRPLDTVQQNIAGTVQVLQAALDAGVRRFVYASTIYVYSDLGGFYRCSKQAAELYIEEYHRKYGLAYTILRFGTIYGPRADNRNSVYRYLRMALTTGRIDCPGTGEEVREYIHVLDAARLSVRVLDPEFANQHVTITGHQPMRFSQMLAMIREILGTGVSIHYHPAGRNDHYSLTPYSFVPKPGKKLVSNCYVDMGQGLVECLQEIYLDLQRGGGTGGGP
jgi:UDP-glucose 4-epimerase